MYIIGLTGGIASGKTTVANMFAEKGIELVDADIVARDVVAPKTQGLRAISDYFGKEILLIDGTLNRAKLREIIFANDNKKTWLNELLHPLIRQEMLAQLHASKSVYTLFVVPLLVENNLTELCDHVLVVDVAESVQVSRTVSRDKVSVEQAKAIVAAQIGRQLRLDAANSVILNNEINSLPEQVNELHEKFLELALASVAD